MEDEALEHNTYSMYQDMRARTGGQLYIGVVGPVRTGKSTFIKRFMDLCVLPNMEDGHEAERARDELPQSSGGRTITTTEPKFIPKQAADITLEDNVAMKVRLIDCVGYMVDGAVGHMEDGQERMVKTPWFEESIPFTQAAEVGTTKVIEDHATVGLVISADGSFGELDRSSYVAAEEKTMAALAKEHKPYVMLLNSARPYSDDTLRLAKELSEKYGVDVLPVNCEQLKKEDIYHILEVLLLGFPLTSVEFYMPKWVEMLSLGHPIKASIIEAVKQFMEHKNTIKKLKREPISLESSYISGARLGAIDLATGIAKITISMEEEHYYKMLSEMTGQKVENEYDLMGMLKELANMKQEYSKVLVAMQQVRNTGYGVVMPVQEEITLEAPELIKHGNKYGVKIKAKSPSIHMIRAGIETEIAPIVGTKEQAEDLINYIKAADNTEEGVWETNIFGKTIEQLVQDGIQTKVSMIGEESQLKLQESMQKIVNDMNGGMVCIII
ncbi:MAG: stage IV sporulation protein A [Lachnospiraceae bacterium]|nr:stage IV sporulation protein A [Lachnospiraceae bacterium]